LIVLILERNKQFSIGDKSGEFAGHQILYFLKITKIASIDSQLHCLAEIENSFLTYYPPLFYPYLLL
jgi:hypothetical protein